MAATLKLLEGGNTVPFIARYRKEVTGSLDEEQIRGIQQLWQYELALQERRDTILSKISEQGKLTPELESAINKAKTLQELEDLYLPYKEKRQTRATIAKARGLEGLAQFLLSFPVSANVRKEAEQYITKEHSDTNLLVPTAKIALEGAEDIIAERISEVSEYRSWIRESYKRGATIQSKLRKSAKDKQLDPRGVYEMYYKYEEPIRRIQPHRVLAVNRGEREKILSVKVCPEEERVLSYLERAVIGKHRQSPTASYVRRAIHDGYHRLIHGAIEREIRSELKQVAEDQAIEVFGENLQKLLLQPPLKGKRVLGVDPAFRTGCKLAVLDEHGKLLDVGVIYPTQKYPGEVVPESRLNGAAKAVLQLIEKFHIQLIAIGNGTASRETEEFVANLISLHSLDIAYIIVNEAGASVYSASPLAKKEFPHLQVEERSAVSIARRVQDPLAELVKIDPKSLGVGQYQHDVTEAKLQSQLDFVVETAVNRVGVDLNTASWPLLQYVAGVSPTIAQNIVKEREALGAYTKRQQLKKVPRLGDKAYEQAAGFLRIRDGENPLDKTPIHPESYGVAKKMLALCGCTLQDIGTPRVKEQIQKTLAKEGVVAVAKKIEVGSITLQDICDALIVPLRDLRDKFPQPLLKKGVLRLEDIAPGMELQGTVRNVTDFGAFVDCGVKVDGLVHISKLKEGFVKHPKEVVSVGDIVTVWVEDIDIPRQRLALTMVPEK